MLKSTLILLGTAAGSGEDLLNCLQDKTATGCSVTTIDPSAGAGYIETPHPYDKNTLYIFEATNTDADKSFTIQFLEFEVDIAEDGTCLDEVYIFADDVTLGPFCGFDDAFFADLDADNEVDSSESDNYDYYYSNLLSTNNLSPNLLSGLSISGPIRIGLKTGDAVNNYGFKVVYTVNDVADPCRAITAAQGNQPPAEYSACEVIRSIDFPRSVYLSPANEVCQGGCASDTETCPVYTNIFTQTGTLNRCDSCAPDNLVERRQLLKCPTDSGHPAFVHKSFHAADTCSCA